MFTRNHQPESKDYKLTHLEAVLPVTIAYKFVKEESRKQERKVFAAPGFDFRPRFIDALADVFFMTDIKLFGDDRSIGYVSSAYSLMEKNIKEGVYKDKERGSHPISYEKPETEASGEDSASGKDKPKSSDEDKPKLSGEGEAPEGPTLTQEEWDSLYGEHEELEARLEELEADPESSDEAIVEVKERLAELEDKMG